MTYHTACAPKYDTSRMGAGMWGHRWSWLRWICAKCGLFKQHHSHPRPAVQKNPFRRQLLLEELEQRDLPSTITVTTLTDGPGVYTGGASPTDTTLRGAIFNAA